MVPKSASTTAPYLSLSTEVERVPKVEKEALSFPQYNILVFQDFWD